MATSSYVLVSIEDDYMRSSLGVRDRRICKASAKRLRYLNNLKRSAATTTGGVALTNSPSPSTPTASTSIDITKLGSTTTREPLQATPASCSTPGHGHRERAQVLVTVVLVPSPTSSRASPASATELNESAAASTPSQPAMAALTVLGAEKKVFTTTPARCSAHCLIHGVDMLHPLDSNKDCSLKCSQFRYMTSYVPTSSISDMLLCLDAQVHGTRKLFEAASTSISSLNVEGVILTKSPWSSACPKYENFKSNCATLVTWMLLILLPVEPLHAQVLGKAPWPPPKYHCNIFPCQTTQLCFSLSLAFNGDCIIAQQRLPWLSFTCHAVARKCEASLSMFGSVNKCPLNFTVMRNWLPICARKLWPLILPEYWRSVGFQLPALQHLAFCKVVIQWSKSECQSGYYMHVTVIRVLSEYGIPFLVLLDNYSAQEYRCSRWWLVLLQFLSRLLWTVFSNSDELLFGYLTWQAQRVSILQNVSHAFFECWSFYAGDENDAVQQLMLNSYMCKIIFSYNCCVLETGKLCRTSSLTLNIYSWILIGPNINLDPPTVLSKVLLLSASFTLGQWLPFSWQVSIAIYGWECNSNGRVCLTAFFNYTSTLTADENSSRINGLQHWLTLQMVFLSQITSSFSSYTVLLLRSEQWCSGLFRKPPWPPPVHHFHSWRFTEPITNQQSYGCAVTKVCWLTLATVQHSIFTVGVGWFDWDGTGGNQIISLLYSWCNILAFHHKQCWTLLQLYTNLMMHIHNMISNLTALLPGYLVHLGSIKDDIPNLELLLEHRTASIADSLIGSRLPGTTASLIYILHFYCLVIDDP